MRTHIDESFTVTTSKQKMKRSFKRQYTEQSAAGMGASRRVRDGARGVSSVLRPKEQKMRETLPGPPCDWLTPGSGQYPFCLAYTIGTQGTDSQRDSQNKMGIVVKNLSNLTKRNRKGHLSFFFSFEDNFSFHKPKEIFTKTVHCILLKLSTSQKTLHQTNAFKC